VNLFVSNLSDEITENELREAFEVYGDVSSVRLIKESGTGRSLGFGSVEMPDPFQACSAVRGLNFHCLRGKVLTVRETRPSSARPPTRLYGRMN